MQTNFKTMGQGILVAVILCLLSGIGFSQGEVSKKGIVVTFPAGMKGSAQRILRTYHALKRDCEIKLGYRYNRDVQVFLCRDHDSFNSRIIELGGRKKPKHIAAVAFSLADIIVLKSAAWTRAKPGEFETIFQHEISHCLLGYLRRRHRGMDLPRWFDEGIAQWVSEGLFHGESVQLHQALRSNAWIPFDQLKRRFPEQEGASALAYAQSESMVRFIAEYNDRNLAKANINGILLRLIERDSFDQALFAVTGLHMGGLEGAWSRQERSSIPFPLTLFPDAIFAITIVVLALLAFANYRGRRNRRLAQMDEEEAAFEHWEQVEVGEDQEDLR